MRLARTSACTTRSLIGCGCRRIGARTRLQRSPRSWPGCSRARTASTTSTSPGTVACVRCHQRVRAVDTQGVLRTFSRGHVRSLQAAARDTLIGLGLAGTHPFQRGRTDLCGHLRRQYHGSKLTSPQSKSMHAPPVPSRNRPFVPGCRWSTLVGQLGLTTVDVDETVSAGVRPMRRRARPAAAHTRCGWPSVVARPESRHEHRGTPR